MSLGSCHYQKICCTIRWRKARNLFFRVVVMFCKIKRSLFTIFFLLRSYRYSCCFEGLDDLRFILSSFFRLWTLRPKGFLHNWRRRKSISNIFYRINSSKFTKNRNKLYEIDLCLFYSRNFSIVAGDKWTQASISQVINPWHLVCH